MSLKLDTLVEKDTASLAQFVAGYRPLPGIFDEMMDGDGRVREHWQPFLTMLAGLGADQINRRLAAADRYLRGSGVFYRVYEDAAGIERPWPLSHVPLIIEPGEWKQLEAGSSAPNSSKRYSLMPMVRRCSAAMAACPPR